MKILPFLLCSLASAQSLLVNAGGPALDGYAADQHHQGGAVWQPGTPGYEPLPTGVHETLRYGVSFAYDIPLEDGLYRITLRLIEPNKTSAGQRRFTITANGQQTEPLDLFALAGLKQPYAREMLALVGNGRLRLEFRATIGNAVVSAIELKKAVIQWDPFPQVADWQQCRAGQTCAGLQWVRLVRVDGSIQEVVGVPPAPPFALQPGVWEAVR